MPEYLNVKDWEKHQHYRDRKPPWIKLYKDLLDNYDFACLSDSNKLLLIEIWLLASKCENRIPEDEKWIRKQLPFNGKVDFKTLIKSGFLVREQSASKTLADCKQNATRSVSVSGVNKDNKFNKYWSENSLEAEYANFKKMRRQIRKPINDVAETRLIAKHKRLVADGNDPSELINLATERCWASFFPIKETKSGKNSKNSNGPGREALQTPADRNAAAAAEYFGSADWETVATND